MSRAPLLLALVALLVPAAAADGASFAPRLAVATSASDLQTLVAWLPGDVPAEAYRVYGVTPAAAPVLLATSTGSEALAPAGFAGYAVSGVVGGVESPLVMAASVGHREECVSAGLVYAIVDLSCLPVRIFAPRLPGDVPAEVYRG